MIYSFNRPNRKWPIHWAIALWPVLLSWAISVAISATSRAEEIQFNTQPAQSPSSPWSRNLSGEPFELPIWQGLAPGSEGITESEITVERGKEKGRVDRSISNVHQPTITVHLPKNPSRELRAAMVICPGGGFTRIVIDKEGNDFARFLNTHGIVGIVLKFRTAKSEKNFYGISAMAADARRALRLVRARAKKWEIDPTRIGVFGFSAGGHVASTLATHYDAGVPSSKDPVERFGCRPDFLGLAYPLVSLQAEVSGTGYQRLLLGGDPTSEQIKLYSNELHVNARTPPAFICHAEDDTGVLVENTRRLAAAYKAAGAACTSFVYTEGGHGYGIRDQGKPIDAWRHRFVDWLVGNDFASPKE